MASGFGLTGSAGRCGGPAWAHARPCGGNAARNPRGCFFCAPCLTAAPFYFFPTPGASLCGPTLARCGKVGRQKRTESATHKKNSPLSSPPPHTTVHARDGRPAQVQGAAGRLPGVPAPPQGGEWSAERAGDGVVIVIVFLTTLPFLSVYPAQRHLPRAEKGGRRGQGSGRRVTQRGFSCFSACVIKKSGFSFFTIKTRCSRHHRRHRSQREQVLQLK
jgi:hypothetical protein